jgi:hypothetical protein
MILNTTKSIIGKHYKVHIQRPAKYYLLPLKKEELADLTVAFISGILQLTCSRSTVRSWFTFPKKTVEVASSK